MDMDLSSVTPSPHPLTSGDLCAKYPIGRVYANSRFGGGLSSRESTHEKRWLAVGRKQVGSWQLAVGSWQLAVGSWQLAVGSWQSLPLLKTED
jgi:hypothetical protein